MTYIRPRQGLKPEEYGLSPGPSRTIPDTPPLTLSLVNTGLNVSVGPEDLEDGESPDLNNVRAEEGGVSPEYDFTSLGPTQSMSGSTRVLAIAPFITADGVKNTVRVRPQHIDYWNGISWLELAGTFFGYEFQRPYVTEFDNGLVVANGADQLQFFGGDPHVGVKPLSADAPVAKFVARIGERLVATGIRPTRGSNVDDTLIAWSGDGNITEWTNVFLGADLVALEPTGPGTSSQRMMGLSTNAHSLIVYRERSIIVGILTGIGTAPFRFTPLQFALGTRSPNSIDSGNLGVGDFFVGDDLMPYLFNGWGTPTPIGLPVVQLIQDVCTDAAGIVGFVDRATFTYWVCIPTTSDSSLLTQAFIFNIREYVKKNRLTWWRRNLAGYTGAGYVSQVRTSNYDPIVNTVDIPVNTLNNIVNQFSPQTPADFVMFGTADGDALFYDRTEPLTSGYFISKQFGSNFDKDLTIDFTRIYYKSRTGGKVLVDHSVDGGGTWSQAKMYVLPATPIGANSVKRVHGITGRRFHTRVRLAQGDVKITRIDNNINLRGPAVR